MGGGSYQNNDQHTTYDQQRPSMPNAPSKPSYPYPPHNQNNYQESYPMYNYPMLYENNYPMPNDRYPPPYGNRPPPPTAIDMMMHGRPTNSYAGDTAAMYSGPSIRPTYHGGGYYDRDRDDRDRYGNNSTSMVGGPMGSTRPDGGSWEGKYNVTTEPTTAMNSTRSTRAPNNDDNSDTKRE